MGIARDIDTTAIAKEVIQQLGLRMTPGELLGNLTVQPDTASRFSIRLLSQSIGYPPPWSPSSATPC